MQNTANQIDRRAEEVMDVLIAISVVSKRLAGKIANLKNRAQEGGENTHERNERTGNR